MQILLQKALENVVSSKLLMNAPWPLLSSKTKRLDSDDIYPVRETGFTVQRHWLWQYLPLIFSGRFFISANSTEIILFLNNKLRSGF